MVQQAISLKLSVVSVSAGNHGMMTQEYQGIFKLTEK